MLGSRRFPSTPLVLANNPWTRGLKFFTVFDGAYSLYNWVLPGRGLSSDGPNQANRTSYTGYQGINFPSSGAHIDWDRAAIGTLTGGGVTVVGRWKPTTGSGEAGSMIGTYESTAKNGFMLYWVDSAVADEGIAFIVGESGSILFAATGSRATYEGLEATVGGRYNSKTRTVDVWQNGMKLATNTDVGTAWLTTATTNFSSGNIAGASNKYVGDIYWTAVFDRCLTDSEMVVWQTQDPLELILGPDDLLQTLDIWAAATTIGAASSWQDRSTWAVQTDLQADASSGGDVPSSPLPSSVWSCATAVGVPTASVTVSGLLYPAAASEITVTTQASIQNIWSVETEIGVNQQVTSGLGGIPGVLAGGRYRR